MDPIHAKAVRGILLSQEVAALGTLHEGEPFVSMVPFALLADATFVIHVSGLAAHTRDMLGHPVVSLLVMAPRDPRVTPQALPRVTVQGEAAPLEGAEREAGREAYLARFRESEKMFSLADFALFGIRPTSARLVGGFAQAKTFTGDGLRRILAGEAP